MVTPALEKIAAADLGDASMLARHLLAAVGQVRVWREIADADRLLRVLIMEHGFTAQEAAAAWREAADIVRSTKKR